MKANKTLGTTREFSAIHREDPSIVQVDWLEDKFVVTFSSSKNQVKSTKTFVVRVIGRNTYESIESAKFHSSFC